MGGHEGGQVASAIAVEKVRATYIEHPSDDPREALVAAFGEAQSAILDFAREHPELHGMGTTCTGVVLKDQHLYYGHVGDSRLYLIRGGVAAALTEDHSYVQRLVREGAITPEQAAVHPDRNVLMAALGMKGNVPADFSEMPIALESGDVLLLCTDGLHGLVTDRELGEVAASLPPAEACHELVRRAKERGGFDNITLQILRVF
jgi:PPM family protein phosphatase